MRPGQFVVGMSVMLVFGLTAHAEPVETVVTAPEVEVRSGPSPLYYATSKLRQGDRVTVLEELEGGSWLAIKPPPASFSWINAKFLERSGNVGQVLGDEVPLRVGSSLISSEPNQEPNAGKLKAKRGLQVWVIDMKGVVSADGTWLMVTPIPGEVRYIPAASVKASGLVQTTASAPPSIPTPAAGTTAPEDPLWRQAQQAEQAGNTPEAMRLYQQLSKQTNDHDLFLRCSNRLSYLRGLGATGAQGYSPDPRKMANATGAPGQSPAPVGQATSQYTYLPENTPRVVQAQQVGYGQAPLPAPAPPAAPAPQWSGPGKLRSAGYYLGKQATYVLESTVGCPPLYVTPQPGVNLEPYVNRYVNLLGPIVYHGEVRKNYMSVMQVAPVQ